MILPGWAKSWEFVLGCTLIADDRHSTG